MENFYKREILSKLTACKATHTTPKDLASIPNCLGHLVMVELSKCKGTSSPRRRNSHPFARRMDGWMHRQTDG